MPELAVKEMPERSTQVSGSLPFQGAGLKAGAVYALGVETAAARLPLLLAPLQAALRAGRPCVLITRLNPEQPPLAEVLAHARRMHEPDRADGGADLLQVFAAVGDYDVNLLLHGAERYLQELDEFEIAPGSMLLIDEADDLYTPHDHGALVQQARAYSEWCERHQHTMVQLHLRASAHRPLMGGNQAAIHYLSGVARVTSQPDGLRMAIDFWDSPAGMRTGTVIPLDPLLRPFRVAPAMNGAQAGFAAAQDLPSLWFVGTPDVDLREWSRQFEVRTAASLPEVLSWCGDSGSAHSAIVVALSAHDEFAQFVEQMTQLRKGVGNAAKIVVRESHYRLREHTQRRRLRGAGVDSVLAHSQSLEALREWLLQPRLEPVTEVTDSSRDVSQPWAREDQDGDETGWLSRSAFVDEVERHVRRSGLSELPCALVVVDFADLLAPDAVNAVKGALQAGRGGDLTTATRGAMFFFLKGCRGRDAVNVVTRCMDDALARRIQCFHLFTGESAILHRVALLRQETAAETLLASVLHDTSAIDLATPLPPRRVDATREHVGMARVAALVAALAWPVDDARAQVDAQSPLVAAQATVALSSQAYARGDYAEAARRGLIELQREPGDHELRFMVANSLAWSGQYREAIQQYGLLAQTPRAASASIGVANVHLWSGRPHLADPLLRRVLSTEPGNADALEALANARRQLRPRSTVRGEALDDSTHAERSTVMLAHRWRDAGLTQIFEVSGERVDESRSAGGPDLRPRKLSIGYQNLDLPFTPKLLLTSDSGVKSSGFGNLALHMADHAVTAELGRVNWGEVVFDPRARNDGLAAARVALAGYVDSPIGRFSAGAVHFAVSDGNRVGEANAQYTPAWQPFPAASGVRAFVGAYARKARQRDPRYWSPTSGYYIGQVGLSLNQSAADWDLNAEVKRSQRAGGEGAQGWTAGLAGSRWLSSDWALRVEGLYIETRRDASTYRSKSIAVSLDRVW